MLFLGKMEELYFKKAFRNLLYKQTYNVRECEILDANADAESHFDSVSVNRVFFH